MALDLDTWRPREKGNSSPITIGWTGSPANLPNLERLAPVLSVLLMRYPFVKLRVFSGQRPALSCPFEYHAFEPGKEPLFVQQLDIGILPLNYEEYSMGKSPIKAIQYLACGVPVVGNIIGATADILNERNSIAVSAEADWLCGLEKLVNDQNLRNVLGRGGREFVLRHHDVSVVREQIVQIFSGHHCSNDGAGQ